MTAERTVAGLVAGLTTTGGLTNRPSRRISPRAMIGSSDRRAAPITSSPAFELDAASAVKAAAPSRTAGSALDSQSSFNQPAGCSLS
jgi:hypothetical protein